LALAGARIAVTIVVPEGTERKVVIDAKYMARKQFNSIAESSAGRSWCVIAAPVRRWRRSMI
jgi:hypothetical protein